MIALFNYFFYLSQLMKFWIIDTDSIIITNIYTQSRLRRMSFWSKTLNTLQFCFKVQTFKGVSLSLYLSLPPPLSCTTHSHCSKSEMLTIWQIWISTLPFAMQINGSVHIIVPNKAQGKWFLAQIRGFWHLSLLPCHKFIKGCLL